MTQPLLTIDWRKLLNAPAPGSRLCPLNDLVPGELQEFCFDDDVPGDAFRLMVFRHGNEVFGYVNQCPHQWLRMNREDGKFLRWSDREIMCIHHSAVFDLLDSGICRMGPCQGSNLIRVPLTVVDGQIEVAGLVS